jgi:hypothetical protein
LHKYAADGYKLLGELTDKVSIPPKSSAARTASGSIPASALPASVAYGSLLVDASSNYLYFKPGVDEATSSAEIDVKSSSLGTPDTTRAAAAAAAEAAGAAEAPPHITDVVDDNTVQPSTIIGTDDREETDAAENIRLP